MGYFIDENGNAVATGDDTGYSSPEYARAILKIQSDYVKATYGPKAVAVQTPTSVTPQPKPPGASAAVPPTGAPAASAPTVHAYIPAYGNPKIAFPRITSKMVAVPTGDPISTIVLSGIATIVGVLGFGSFGDIKKVLNQVVAGLKDIANTLMNFIWSMSHIVRWVLNALRWIWEKILGPLVAHVEKITSKLTRILDRILKPYLQMLEHIRQQILAIYKRFFLPVIEFIQKIRVLLSLLKILRVPGIKKLDEKLAKIEGKLIGVIQAALSRANDHSGLLNILLNTRMTLQHGVLMRSMYETQGAWINQWWNAQTAPRSAADAKAQVDAELRMQEKPRVKELDDYLRTRVYVTTQIPGPEERKLDAILRRGAA